MLSCPIDEYCAKSQVLPDTSSTKEAVTTDQKITCNSTVDSEPPSFIPSKKWFYDNWHIVLITIIVIIFIVFILVVALVCGSKHPEKVRECTKMIGLEKRIYGNSNGEYSDDQILKMFQMFLIKKLVTHENHL